MDNDTATFTPRPPEFIENFFNSLSKDSLELVDQFYDPNAQFIDPVVSFTDRNQIKNYYAKLYTDVESIRFEFKSHVQSNQEHAVVWTMVLKAKLDPKKPIVVDGVSLIRFGGPENKAVYHRDYFDMGEFVYERIPVLSLVIRKIKQALSGGHAKS